MCDVWDIRCLGCRMFKICNVRDVGDVECLGCAMFGIWDVGSLRRGISEISNVRGVKCVGCEMFAEMCDVDLQNAVLEEGLLDYIF